MERKVLLVQLAWLLHEALTRQTAGHTFHAEFWVEHPHETKLYSAIFHDDPIFPESGCSMTLPMHPTRSRRAVPQAPKRCMQMLLLAIWLRISCSLLAAARVNG